MGKNYVKKLIFTIAASFFVLDTGMSASAKQLNMQLEYDGTVHNYQAEEVKMQVNGTFLAEYHIPPVIIEDRTLVPVRAIADSLGVSIDWEESSRQVYITQDDNTIVLTIDKKQGIRNGVVFSMEVAPKIINGSTMIPARYVADALNCNVKWDAETRTVIIHSKGFDEDDTELEEKEEPKEEPKTEKPETVKPNQGAAQENKQGANVIHATLDSAIAGLENYKILISAPISKIQKTQVGNDRIAIDIYGATMKTSAEKMLVTGSDVVTSLRFGQFQTQPDHIARVVFDLKKSQDCNVAITKDGKAVLVSFSTENSGATMAYEYGASSGDIGNNSGTIIGDGDKFEGDQDVMQGNFKNFTYDPNKRRITMSKLNGLSLEGIQVEDNYWGKELIFNLPGDFTETFGRGLMQVDDFIINSILIQKTASGSRICISEKTILAYELSEDSSGIHIGFKDPREVYDKVVLLDAGHGKGDQGTSGNGLIEKEINLSIMKKVYQKLEQDSSIKVYATRLDDSYPENLYRAQLANATADLFVSIHQNSASPNPTPNGIETLYTAHANEVPGKLTSQIAADIMQNHLISALGATNRGVKDRPDLIVLNKTTVPTILIEDGFLSNPAEAAKLSSDGYQEEVASAIYRGIVDILKRYPPR